MQPTLDFIPLTVIPFLLVGAFILILEIGFWFGKRQKLKHDKPKDAILGISVGAAMGLLGFMLAFTFGMAGTRFEARRGLVLEESNAIGTTYLRAGYLPEPNRSKVQTLLKAYVDLRVDAATNYDINDIITKTDTLQNELWAHATEIAEKNPGSVMAALFIQSLNEVIDVHSKRVAALLLARIPNIIWYSLFFLALLCIGALGYLSGLDARRSLVINGALILAFSSVLYLISDLDRPREGALKVSQQTLIDLQKKMKNTSI